MFSLLGRSGKIAVLALAVLGALATPALADHDRDRECEQSRRERECERRRERVCEVPRREYRPRRECVSPSYGRGYSRSRSYIYTRPSVQIIFSSSSGSCR